MVYELHLISEPLYQHTWCCLNHYQYKEAIFTAERIFAENPHDETAVHLLATCLYRVKGPKITKIFLKKQEIISVKSRYLLAKCYFEIGQFSEAEDVLVGSAGEFEAVSKVAAVYRDSAPFALKLLADIYKQSERRKSAINSLRKCLELDPLSWEAYTDLVDLRDNVEPIDVFSLPKNAVLNNQSCLRALSNRINIGEMFQHNCPSKKRSSDIHDSQEDLSISLENVNPKANNDSSIFIDEQLSNSFDSNDILINPKTEHLLPNLLSESASVQTNDSILQKSDYSRQFKTDRTINGIMSQFGNSNLNPSLTAYEFVSVVTCNTRNIKCNSLKTQVFKDNSKKNRHSNKRGINNHVKNIELSSPHYKISPLIIPACKVDVINSSGISTVPILPLDFEKAKLNDAGQIERNMDNSEEVVIKETHVPRTRLQYAKAAAAQKSSSKKEYIYSTDECCSHTAIETDTRLQSAICYLKLLTDMGKAYKCAKSFKFYEAISRIKQLPRHHSETALVSTWLALIHTEMNEKCKACDILAESFKNEPWQLHGLPLFSSLLWLLNKEKELLYLSTEVLEMDRENPEIWCVLGNSMSLNRENEVAIRYFQRAIQTNPSYAYGYILLGHEYLYQDELDKALTSYRRASDLDRYNYHANFYIATVYNRQDNFLEAESLLKEILKTFPDSLMVLTNLAVIRSKLKQNFVPEIALELLERACNLYPNELLCRFYKASILYQLGRCNDALADLKIIEVYKEARIFLLISSIYKQLGQHTQSMLYNTWATELDPKCTNDWFLVDHNFVGNTNLNSTGRGCSSSVTNTSSRFLTGHRNSESTQDEAASNNQINYD